MSIMDDFYVRCFVGRRSQYGHEFLEFEFQPNGKLRYVNNSHYKRETIIRKKMFVSDSVMKEVKRIVEESGIVELDDSTWPEPTSQGKQEIEVILGDVHTSFNTAEIGSLSEVRNEEDFAGLRSFYYLMQDLKCFAFALVSMHFKVRHSFFKFYETLLADQSYGINYITIKLV